jgi:hypothetical protein
MVNFVKIIHSMVDEGITKKEIRDSIKGVEDAFNEKDTQKRAEMLDDLFRF